MIPPELPTPEEQKAIDKMVEVDIDHWVESQKVHEVVKDDDEPTDF